MASESRRRHSLLNSLFEFYAGVQMQGVLLLVQAYLAEGDVAGARDEFEHFRGLLRSQADVFLTITENALIAQFEAAVFYAPYSPLPSGTEFCPGLTRPDQYFLEACADGRGRYYKPSAILAKADTVADEALGESTVRVRLLDHNLAGWYSVGQRCTRSAAPLVSVVELEQLRPRVGGGNGASHAASPPEGVHRVTSWGHLQSQTGCPIGLVRYEYRDLPPGEYRLIPTTAFNDREGSYAAVGGRRRGTYEFINGLYSTYPLYAKEIAEYSPDAPSSMAILPWTLRGIE
jgi:hypothetical protein